MSFNTDFPLDWLLQNVKKNIFDVYSCSIVYFLKKTFLVFYRSWQCGPTQTKLDKWRTASFALSRTILSASALMSPAGVFGQRWSWITNSLTLRRLYYTGSSIFHLNITLMFWFLHFTVYFTVCFCVHLSFQCLKYYFLSFFSSSQDCSLSLWHLII